MTNVNWSKVGVYVSLVIAFLIAGFGAIGDSFTYSSTIVAILTVLAGLFHGSAVTTAVAQSKGV